MGMDSVHEVVKNSLCISCGACAVMYPDEIAGMNYQDKLGIFVPEVKNESDDAVFEDAFSICPGKGYPIVKLAKMFGNYEITEDVELGVSQGFFAAHSNDEEIKEKASSGGVMTAIANYLLEEGAVDGVIVTGIEYGENGPLPAPFIARTKADLLSAQGSKYCPSPSLLALKEVFETAGKFALIGTPCQIAALRLMQEKNRELKDKVVITIGNFCGGFRDFRDTKLLINRAGFETKNIAEFRYRGGGQPGYMFIKDKSGSEVKLPYPGYARMTGICKYYRCRVCVDATAELADISCGDAWIDRFLTEPDNAWSLIISRSSKATTILDEMNKRGLLTRESVSIEEIKLSQKGNLDSKKKRQSARRLFLGLIGSKTPDYDGGYFDESAGVLFEAKVTVSHWLFNFSERVGCYPLLSKLLGRNK